MRGEIRYTCSTTDRVSVVEIDGPISMIPLACEKCRVEVLSGPFVIRTEIGGRFSVDEIEEPFAVEEIDRVLALPLIDDLEPTDEELEAMHAELPWYTRGVQ